MRTYRAVLLTRRGGPEALQVVELPLEVAGVVDAVGPGVGGVRVGQRVAALTVWGGYAGVEGEIVLEAVASA